MSTSSDSKRELLRHTLATVAYRGGKAVTFAPAGFNSFSAHETTRTPEQILAHIGDLYDWALSLARGKQTWHNSTPQAWDAEVERFFATVKAFDDYLASEEQLHCPAEKLFQGPVADSLTHIGQIAMLRRMAGIPVAPENFVVADIDSERLGPDQPDPVSPDEIWPEAPPGWSSPHSD